MRAHIERDQLVVYVDGTEPTLMELVRGLPVRRYDARRGMWLVPHVHENWEALRGHPDAAAELAGLPAPTRSAYTIGEHQGYLAVHAPQSAENLAKCKAIPEARTFKGHPLDAWVCLPTAANVLYLRDKFPGATWTEGATRLSVGALAGALGLEAPAAAPTEVTDYKFGRFPLMTHQVTAFLLGRPRVAFAYLMEQGTGKTPVTIHDVCWNAGQGAVEAVLVVCPNSIKTNWEEEVHRHSPPHVEHEVVVWRAGLTRDEEARLWGARAEGRLPWLVMNVEAFSSPKGVAFAERFLAKYRVFMAVDESSRIKKHTAKRTRAVVRLGRLAARRRILTGTPVTQSPLDVYAQFDFLDAGLLGFSGYYPFRNTFAIMGGHMGKQVIGYSGLDRLKALVAPHSYRVLQSECLDLPPVTYARRVVELTPEQRRLYRELKKDMLAKLGGTLPLSQGERAELERLQERAMLHVADQLRWPWDDEDDCRLRLLQEQDRGATVTVTMVLTQMLRLQQLTGGFLPPDGLGGARVAIEGGNPKLDELMELVEETPGKTLVWARFRDELRLIAAALREAYGPESVVEFHGGVSEDDRRLARVAFQDPEGPARFFVGQQETGGIGLNLTQARLMVFFSNTFKLEDRLQAVKRAERYGMAGTLLVVDLVAEKTVDVRVERALRDKKNLADAITGDQWSEWL